LSTGGEASVAGATLLELADAPPDLDVAAAVEAGVRRIRVTAPHDLSSTDPLETIAFVRLLREAAGDHVPVEWTGRLLGGVDSLLLLHLSPPASAREEEPDIDLMAWRARHQPGLCYYRVGPGFVFVKDVRTASTAARFRLEGDDRVTAFRALENVVSVEHLDPNALELLAELERESLALRLGGFATLLPSRMRRWPVPSHEV
jgi:hypothetical protein